MTVTAMSALLNLPGQVKAAGHHDSVHRGFLNSVCGAWANGV
jgi:hypothetical protein